MEPFLDSLARVEPTAALAERSGELFNLKWQNLDRIWMIREVQNKEKSTPNTEMSKGGVV